MHRVVVFVVRAAPIVGSRERDRPLAGQVHLHDGIHHQQHGVASVALHVQVVQVFYVLEIGGNVLLTVAFPGV